MRESDNLIEEFRDKDYRESYAEDYLHSFIAMQFQAVREQRKMTQQELADSIGTKQTAISRLENVNNRSRNIRLLEKAAYALGCRLRVSLETFGSLVTDEGPNFSRAMLERASFDDDPAFKPALRRVKRSTSGEPAPFKTSRPTRLNRRPLGRDKGLRNRRFKGSSNSSEGHTINRTINKP